MAGTTTQHTHGKVNRTIWIKKTDMTAEQEVGQDVHDIIMGRVSFFDVVSL